MTILAKCTNAPTPITASYAPKHKNNYYIISVTTRIIVAADQSAMKRYPNLLRIGLIQTELFPNCQARIKRV